MHRSLNDRLLEGLCHNCMGVDYMLLAYPPGTNIQARYLSFERPLRSLMLDRAPQIASGAEHLTWAIQALLVYCGGAAGALLSKRQRILPRLALLREAYFVALAWRPRVIASSDCWYKALFASHRDVDDNVQVETGSFQTR